jgi:hypothetical protein
VDRPLFVLFVGVFLPQCGRGYPFFVRGGKGEVCFTNTGKRTTERRIFRMTTPCKRDIVFILTREDVLLCAQEMGIPAEAITDDVFEQVRKGVEWGLDCWAEVMQEAISFALKS